ncbi:alpha-1,2-mannosidase-like protein [Nemania sp. NC0429]|nr:alpha-1,2-mannosidase-like protein [Nemania sp. NC0429]
MAGPFLTTFPRRRRILAGPLFFLFIWALLPIESFNPPRRLLFGITAALGRDARTDVLQFVDPLIGTVNGGHVFPGATLPYGMAKPVADTNNRGEAAAGFVSDDSLITGFSQLHDSGTGGSPSMGNFPLFAHPGCPEDDFTKCSYDAAGRATPRVNGSATARPGYFAIGLNNSVYAEMTATAHTSLFRFTFPSEAEVTYLSAPSADGVVQQTVPNSPLVLMDMIDLGGTRSGGSIKVNSTTGRMMGGGGFRPSFGQGQYDAYFCADFRGAEIRRTGVFLRTNITDGAQALGKLYSDDPIPQGSVGTWLQFTKAPKNQILARVGVSFISAAQACENAEREIGDFGFSKVVAAAETAWRDKLSVIRADHAGMSLDMLKTFWSGLYRTMLSPQDYTGENQLWESDEPYYDSFYCIWDSFRAQHPLLTIIDPETQTDMVRALIDIYKHEGKLPDCRMSFSKGYTQGGSNADVVLADALIKNLTRGIDWELGYEAVVSDAEEEPTDWSVSGRGGIDSWRTLGYIPVDDDDRKGVGPLSRSISRTVEYAYDDFTIALMAHRLGHKGDEAKYLKRSHNWRNLWHAEQDDHYRDKATGKMAGSAFQGFLQPRFSNGTFSEQTVRLCSPIHEQHVCYFDTRYSTYEGSPWLYSFYVPQDMASLIGLMGGPARFVERLDYFHASGINYMGNEPNFLPTFQFHYAGRPGRSAHWVHQYIPSQFNSSVAGIPGNDDCAMGAFSAFAFMGFFPVAGQDVYLLTPPLFREVSVRTPDGRRWATLRNANFDPAYAAGRYIQSARLDGRPYTRNWIAHDFFTRGGVLEFVLGPKESEWGTRKEDLPPSLSAGTT